MKKTLFKLIIILLLLVLLITMIPIPVRKTYQAMLGSSDNSIEYTSVTITLDGSYHINLWKAGSFSGTLEVSGYPVISTELDFQYVNGMLHSGIAYNQLTGTLLDGTPQYEAAAFGYFHADILFRKIVIEIYQTDAQSIIAAGPAGNTEEWHKLVNEQ